MRTIPSCRVFEYRQHWLHLRADTKYWYIYWCQPGTRRVLRRSTGQDDLEEAKRQLIAFVDSKIPGAQTTPMPVTRHFAMVSSPVVQVAPAAPVSPPLLVILADYVGRLQGRRSHRLAQHVLAEWSAFCQKFNIVYVHEMSLPVQEQFVAWRRFNRKTGKPLSNGTINRFLEVLRASFHDAWRRGELPSFPYVRMLQKPPPRDKFFTRDEITRLLRACDEPHLYRFVMLALHTLQRPSAILQLRVNQVDLVAGRINFLPPGDLQSNKRRPVVPITNALRAVLETAIAESQAGWIVEYQGRPITKLRTSFRAACKRAGIPAAGPGILRHTGATHLAAAGVPIREISGMLGHTNSRITEEVYAKRRPEFLANASQALDNLFGPSVGATRAA